MTDYIKLDWNLREYIVHYLQDHKDDIVYPSDIADFYGLSRREVFLMCEEMKKEGLLR